VIGTEYYTGSLEAASEYGMTIYEKHLGTSSLCFVGGVRSISSLIQQHIFGTHVKGKITKSAIMIIHDTNFNVIFSSAGVPSAVIDRALR
jgi:hypothetical protein